MAGVVLLYSVDAYVYEMEEVSAEPRRRGQRPLEGACALRAETTCPKGTKMTVYTLTCRISESVGYRSYSRMI